MHRRRSIISSVAFVLLGISLLSACSAGTSGSTRFNPTFTLFTPTATVTLPVAATEPPVATATTYVEYGPSTPIVVEQPTQVITAAPGDGTSNLKTPAANLNITKPGPGSNISSPVLLSGYAYPGYDNKVTIELHGEDGRLMASQEIKLAESESGWVSFSTQIPFTINSAAESAYLILVSYDGYGRRIALCNVPIMLMQIGESEIETTGFAYQPFYFSEPENATAVSGGTLHVDGYAHPYNLNPVVIELANENGEILVTKIIPIRAVGDANFMHFSADIPYSVSEATPVRVTVRQIMDHTPYLDLALSSITLTLNP
jgi:hypothetical protein